MLPRKTQVNTKSTGLDKLIFYGITKTITHWVNKIKNGANPKYISSKEPLPILCPSLYLLFTCESMSRDVTILDPMCTHSRLICTFQYPQSCPNTPPPHFNIYTCSSSVHTLCHHEICGNDHILLKISTLNHNMKIYICTMIFKKFLVKLWLYQTVPFSSKVHSTCNIV